MLITNKLKKRCIHSFDGRQESSLQTRKLTQNVAKLGDYEKNDVVRESFNNN